MLALLRPHPHRGDTVAAGVVVLTVFWVVTDARFAGDWSDALRFVLSVLIAGLVAAVALQAATRDDVPRPYESVLYVASFLLVLVALVELATLLGSEGGPGTVVWVGALLAAYASHLARDRHSAIMTLLAALALVVVVFAFVDWVFDPGSATPFKWVLFVCALALTAAAVWQRDARRRHAVSLVDAAGLTAIALAALVIADQILSELFGSLLGGDEFPLIGGPAGWELVFFVFGCGLVAYGCVDRERVPAFLGVVLLGLFAFEALQAGPDGPSLIGWPVVLLVIAAGLLAIGLRPRQDLPPEPPVPAPVPVAPSAPGGTAAADPDA